MTAATILKSLLPIWEIRWREAASCLILALPIVAIAADSDSFHAPSALSLVVATFYLTLTWHRSTRRFLVPEVLMAIVYPSAAPILIAAWFLALRRWKEAHLARRTQERRRSALLADLGLHDAPSHAPIRWVAPLLVLAWVSEVISGFWPGSTTRLAVVVFALFASGLVSMLTSAPTSGKVTT